MSSTDVIVAGHICLDIIPKLYHSDSEFVPGKLIEAGPVTMSTGGVVSNTGIALHRLGVDVRLVGKTGNDIFGKIIRDIISSSGSHLSNSMIVSPGESSSYTVVINPPNTDRMFIHSPGCNATFNSMDISDELLQTGRLFHFGYPPLMQQMVKNNGEETVNLFQRAKIYGLTTSLDMAMPDESGWSHSVDWPAYLRATLPSVDVFMPNLIEISTMLRNELNINMAYDHGINPELLSHISQWLLNAGAAIVAIKLGESGLYIRTSKIDRLNCCGAAIGSVDSSWIDREVWAPCYEVDVIGATGSGDATIAGFILGILKRMNFMYTIKTACAVGASSVEALDAISGISSWDKTYERINSGWKRRELQIIHKNWYWDSTGEYWERI